MSWPFCERLVKLTNLYHILPCKQAQKVRRLLLRYGTLGGR